MVTRHLLFLKLIRDAWASRAQNLAVGLTIFLGVAFYGAATMAYRNLDASYRYSYDRLRFEDFGITFREAPKRAAQRLLKIRGVMAVEGRLNADMAMELPKQKNRRVLGHLISVPTASRPTVNDLQVVEGTYLRSQSAHEVLLESAFAKFHDVHPGDRVVLTEGTSRVSFTVVGIVRSPEFIYVVRSKQDLFPMPDVYGIAYMSDQVLGNLTGRTGTINEVRARLEDPSRLDAAMRETREALAIYRPDDPIPRSELPSHQLLQQDIDGFKTYSVLFPALFLSVAGMTFYTLMARAVTRQRAIIGLLRALGFSRGEVIRHYVSSGVIVGGVSSLLGTLTGWFLAIKTTVLYLSFSISIPFIRFEPAWSAILTGFLLGVTVCVLSSVAPARLAAAIGPAEALRGAKQSGGAAIRFDRWLPGLRLLWRVPIRNVFRQPKRSIATLLGIVAGLALIIVAQGLMDSSTAMIQQMIGSMFQDDLRAGFIVPRDGTTVARVRQWPGVIWAEGQLDVPIEFTKGSTTYSALLAGVSEGSRFKRLQDESGQSLSLPPDGAIFGPTLRRKLRLSVGQIVELRLPKGRSSIVSGPKHVRVAGFCDEPVGTIAYMRSGQVWRLFHRELGWPPNAATSIAVKTDPGASTEVRRRLLDLGGVGAVTSISDMRTMVNELIELFRGIVGVMLLFGSCLAFAIVFSMVSVNVVERSAEIATLRTLGLSRTEIVLMIGLENLILTALGIVIGLPAGYAMTKGFLVAGQTEEQMDLFKMSVTILPATYILSTILITIVVFVAQIPALFAACRLNLAKAAKEQAA